MSRTIRTRASRPHFGLLATAVLATSAAAAQPQLYSFGNPTADEQAYIEMINRARANPTAEGARLAATTNPDILASYTYYQVDLTMLQAELSAFPATPPLAPNGRLTTAARDHSQWMFVNKTQSHYETNPANDPFERMTAAGYDWWTAGENIYAFVYDPEYGHAGFEVDWGGGDTGGMQAGRGHRATIHNEEMVEIGVGVVNGTNGPVGPQLVTQDFGSPMADRFFGTGVAYYDLNGNDFYDIGEGIAGLDVQVSGADFYCETAIGGGWAVPVPSAAASRAVTFSGLGINATRTLTVPASENAKADLKLAYAPPAITSPAVVSADEPQTFAFSATGGATGYQWTRLSLSAAAPENAESLDGVTTSTLGTYSVLNTAVKQEGASSFHLVNPGTIGTQWIELSRQFYGSGTPNLVFQSRLRLADTSQLFKVQIREEGSSIWHDADIQIGDVEQSSFSARSVDLAGYSGKRFHVRFALEFRGGSYWPYIGDEFGWFIDAISLTGADSVSGGVTEILATNSGSYTLGAGDYLLTVKPIISGIEFPGSAQTLTVTGPPAATFAIWAAAIETENSLPAGSISGNPNGDADADGVPNLVEYALGASPVTGNDAAGRLPALIADPDDLVVRYTIDSSRTDVSPRPVTSADLADWKAPGDPGAPTGFTDSLVSIEGTLEIREARVPKASGARFIRLAVSRP